MSAGNRKNQYRPVVQEKPSPKADNLYMFLTMMLAVATIIAVVLMPHEAQASEKGVRDCWWTGTDNGVDTKSKKDDCPVPPQAKVAAQSKDRPGNCQYAGFTQAFTTTDAHEDLMSLFDNAGWYPVWNCGRVTVTEANKIHEVRELRSIFLEETYGERFDLPYVFCRPSFDEAYLMAEKWIFNDVTVTPAQKRVWNVYARNWVDTHKNCRIGN